MADAPLSFIARSSNLLMQARSGARTLLKRTFRASPILGRGLVKDSFSFEERPKPPRQRCTWPEVTRFAAAAVPVPS